MRQGFEDLLRKLTVNTLRPLTLTITILIKPSRGNLWDLSILVHLLLRPSIGHARVESAKTRICDADVVIVCVWVGGVDGGCALLPTRPQ